MEMLDEAGSSETGHLKITDDERGFLQAGQRLLHRGKGEHRKMRLEESFKVVEDDALVVDNDNRGLQGLVQGAWG